MPFSRRMKRLGNIGLSVLAVATLGAVGSVVLDGGVTPEQPVSAKVQDYYDSIPAPTITEAPVVPLVSVIGDSYTAGSGEGGLRAANWVPKADAALTNAVVQSKASGGSGYVNAGPKGKVFRDLVPEAVKPTTDVIVFFGSRNDERNALEVQAAAESAYAEARKIAPEAKLLVIGAPWVNADVPDNIFAINGGLAAATNAAGGTFVDPIAANWFIENLALIGRDGVHPTDEGHAYLAGKIAPHIKAALEG